MLCLPFNILKEYFISVTLMLDVGHFFEGTTQRLKGGVQFRKKNKIEKKEDRWSGGRRKRINFACLQMLTR